MQFDWNNIDTVLLDMDGTLLDLHFDSHFWLEYMPRIWATRNGFMLEDARIKLFRMLDQHSGTLNWYCVDFWSTALGLDIMELKGQVAHKIAYRPTAEKFLRRCQQESNDVRMVTNAHRKVLELKIVKTNIDQYFDQLLCSHELEHPKEDAEFWHKLHQLKAFDPQRTLFIDDSEAVLESAARHGIKHIYSIAQPDSSMQRKTSSRFPMLNTLA
ncbi:MAG: putative hydrolase of the HAD superfamily [Paracoccaceae bacterium]|jgi:putative hydrolase of the HAD superfamily